ncbi:hypothetical protein RFX60_11005 [Acinetobacter sp. 11520]|nr:hypothetical protein [Acinetobacter sp. 11520]
MSDFDLITDIDESVEESPEIQEFLSHLDGVDKLWRLTDLTAPNFFTLRSIDKGKISLINILPDFIDANADINLFDFSFCHLVRDIRRWKLNRPDHFEYLLNSNCLYLVISEIIQRVRSNSSFREKISYIAITPGQESKPLSHLSHHWDLVYADPKYDKDEDLIELLMSCCELNPDVSIRTKDFLEYIYQLELNTTFHNALTA